jgi:hypothetical protein
MAMATAAMVVAIGGSAIVAHGGGGGGTGKIVGYAYINDTGDVRGNLSLNVGNKNVDVDVADGSFCFKNLPFKFKGLQAAIDYRDSTSATSTAQVVNGNYSCSGNAEAEVTTVTSAGALEVEPIFVQFYK